MAPGNSDDFDGYRKWLGISERQRPPSYYELLGMSLDEDDPDVIRSAVEQRRQFVESKRGEGHDQVVSEILYCISEAETTLLDSEMRRNYDRRLNLFEKRRMDRQVDPYAPRSRVKSQPGRTVGEDSGIVSTFAGIMAVFCVGFGIMAWFSFQLPWDRLPKNLGTGTHTNDNPLDKGEGVLFARPAGDVPSQQTTNSSNALPQKQSPNNASSTSTSHSSRETPASDASNDTLVTADVTIQSIDLDSRTLTVSNKSKTAEFEIGKKAQILVDGNPSSTNALKPGQQVSISFLADYNLISKIEISTNPVSTTSSLAAPSDDLVTIDAQIDTVDLDSRIVSVTRKSKTTALEFSRKTEVVVDGQDGTIESLKAGQAVLITLNPELNIIVKIETVDGEASPAQANESADATADDTVTIEATLTEINQDARTVSITRKSKTTLFDVSRKTVILVDSQAASLDSLKSGQVATITVNPELNMIVKIEVVSVASSSEEK